MTTLAITCGEPAGIGPELLVLLERQAINAELCLIGDLHLLQSRARLIGLPDWQPAAQDIHAPLAQPCQPGQLNAANAKAVLECLDIAAQGCLQGRFNAMVTAPLHKAIINQAGISFSGHTEYLAQLCQVEKPVMMLAAEGLRVALVTTHLPLHAVATAITETELTHTLEIVHHELQTRFHRPRPHIKVCGLNPHAGEGGHIGREEIDIIIPVLEKLKQQGLNLSGPWPADTLLTETGIADADAVVAMYHDQGLPVLKYKGFNSAVNITLGLPIIRTSVDHGTALDLAGTRKMHTGSLQVAIDTAINMAQPALTLT